MISYRYQSGKGQIKSGHVSLSSAFQLESDGPEFTEVRIRCARLVEYVLRVARLIRRYCEQHEDLPAGQSPAKRPIDNRLHPLPSATEMPSPV